MSFLAGLLKQKDNNEEKKRPSSSKRAKSSKKITKNAFYEHAEESCKAFFIKKKNTKGVFVIDFALYVVGRVTTLMIVRVISQMS